MAGSAIATQASYGVIVRESVRGPSDQQGHTGSWRTFVSERGFCHVNLFVGITDPGWFNYLSARSPGEVNFWRPSGIGFEALSSGEPFLFRLRDQGQIVGGGFFVRSSKLPLSLAWLAFEERNGSASRDELWRTITGIRRGQGKPPEPDPVIGNIVLIEPFFWPRDRWIPYRNRIGNNKRLNTEDPAGAQLWNEVQERLRAEPRYEELETIGAEDPVEQVRRWALERMGQGAFRISVTEAYQRQCAVTHEHALPVLEAAHILPVADHGSHSVSNGILLRADLHILFDRGYITFDENYRLLVSGRLEAEWHNGREYLSRKGQRIALPHDRMDWPSQKRLAVHRETVFVA